MAIGLKAPQSLHIDFKPSARQYEVWKALQPECMKCGGQIIQQVCGIDRNGQPLYEAVCSKCGEKNIPQVILSGGAAGGGKCLDLDSSVCTPFGFRKLKDLNVGDIISNPLTGKQQRIIQIHPKGTFPFYRVYFVDGTYTDCSEGHLWRCHQSRKKSKKAKLNPKHFAEYGDDRIWETKAMYKWYQRKKNGMCKGVHLIIPLTEPVEFTIGNRPRKIKPYILGALVGDGCIANSQIKKGAVQMTTMDNEIVQRFVDAGYDMTHYSQKANNRAKNYYLRDSELMSELDKLGILGNTSQTHKIPRQYLYSTIKERIELMQGLIDTDGYVDSRGHMSYTSTSKQLAEDVAFIVRSLGGIATITKNVAGYRDKVSGGFIRCSDTYDVQIRTKLNPELCGLTRKKTRASHLFNGGNSELGKRITDIEYIGERESFCITVDDPSGLYIADNFTVTHNSYLGSCWLISTCLRWSDMRMVVARATLKSLRESTWNTICSVAKSWGLEEGVHYKVNSLYGEMTFWNDSKIIMKELSESLIDPDFNRLGSSEFSGCFIDEVSQISQKAVDVIGSRLRWNVENTTVVPKLLMSTNPCLGWVRERFVQDGDGNPAVLRPGDLYIPFSVYDNPDEKFRRAYLVALDNIQDKATRERLKYGNWDFVDTNEAAAYWNFDGAKHLVTNLREKVYNPLKPIISSWDFNVQPYMSTLSLQIDYEHKKVYVLDEILGKPEEKENNTPKLSRKIANKYLTEKHLGGLFITGDPAGLSRSTQTEEGVNNYTIIMGNMDNPILRVQKKLLTKQPAQVTRLEYVNGLLNGYDGWEILIDMRCRRLTEDLVYQKKNADGTKSKAKVTDPKSGVKYEKYGHLSDCLDYALCLFLNNTWAKFQKKGNGSTIETTTTPIYGGFSY